MTTTNLGPSTDPVARHKVLVHYAIKAPSTLNTQPWHFRVTPDYLELRPDPTRQLRVTDPSGRELLISCGAALANAEVAGRQYGYEMEIETHTSHSLHAPWLARLHSRAPRPPRELDTQLFRAIPMRHTVRRPYLKRGIAAGVMRKIMDVAEHDGVTLSLVDDEETRNQLATTAFVQMMDLAQDEARLQEADRWRASWQTTRKDGLPQGAHGMPAHEYLWHYLCGGVKTVAQRASASLHRRILNSPRLLIVSSDRDEGSDWLRTGYAMERALLCAAYLDIQASYFGSLVCTPEARAETKALLNADYLPQLVIGLGHSLTEPITPRRPVEEFLQT